jgi:para-aminobenzoate synthetase component 1
MQYPLTKPFLYCDPLSVFGHFHAQNGAVFLDSATLREKCGRYSFIAIDPFMIVTCKNGIFTVNGEILRGNPFTLLASLLSNFSCLSHEGLPPFQGGVAGYFSYDLYQYLENIPLHAIDDMNFPDMMLGFYDVVLAFDHLEKQAWVFSNGYPCKESRARQYRAEQRLAWICSEMNNINSFVSANLTSIYAKADVTEHGYKASIAKVIDYILAGDIFEANISQRFKACLPNHFSKFSLYRQLRAVNPAPFAAYLIFNDIVLASASPERFLKLTQEGVETRPIKGTRPRGKSPVEDQCFAHELLHSAKDHAENVMIVDLLRNDLSKVCENHSVHVSQLCGLESYATVHHLVSVVTGKLKEEFKALDLLKACFPGGSITGAPKIRAMEIIAELEPTARGPYCGSIGYIGFDGVMDTSIVIRTFCIKANVLTFQSGGAIVADSDPDLEYEETLTKASALHKVLCDG